MPDEVRPSLPYRATTATLQQLESSQLNGQQRHPSELKTENTSEEEADATPRSSISRIHILDILWFFSIFVMLVWPWIFFGVVFAKNGVQMDNHMAKVVTDNPHATTYFVTLVCSFISMIISALFSIAIIRFAQELVTNRAPTQPFHLRVLLAFRHQTWPLGKKWKDFKYLMAKGRWWPAVLLIHHVGNIACTISPIQPAIFPVMYQSTTNSFSTQEPVSSSPIAYPTIIGFILAALGDIVAEGQNFQTNLVAESVITFGVKSFGLPPHLPDPKYLQLYERMIQGILEYETTYMRLIYSTVPNPPSTCVRFVTGSMNYQVVGWFVTRANIGFLIPITLINLAALIALFLAVIMAKSGGRRHPPSEPRRVTYHENMDQNDQVPDEWKNQVTFHPTTVLKEYFKTGVKSNLDKGAEGAAELAEDEVKQIPEGKEIAFNTVSNANQFLQDPQSVPSNQGPVKG